MSRTQWRKARICRATPICKSRLKILNEGKKVCILAGRGAIHARDQLAAMAERVGAPVVKALLGKGALPDNSEFSVGGVGLLCTKPAQEALEECDTLLIAGSCFPYIE